MSARPDTPRDRPHEDPQGRTETKELKDNNQQKHASEELDEALEDSFPASDPPSQTAGR